MDSIFNRHKKYMNNIQKEDFLKSFELMYQCTRSTKLLDFQYRLLHLSLTTNKEAFHYFRLVDNDRCTFCNVNQENIHHIMLHCRHSRDIWEGLQDYLHTKTGINIPFSDSEKLFGSSFFPFFRLYNHLIILTKQFLYASRCIKELPTISKLKLKIEREYKIEKGSNNGPICLREINKKWSPLFT